MRRRGLTGLFGVIIASCAAVPGSARVQPVHGTAAACARRTSAARSTRPADGDALTPEQARAMLRDFTDALRARYGVADERALAAAHRVPARVVIPLRFHVLTDGRYGRLSRSAVDQQVAVLNASYGGRLAGAGGAARSASKSSAGADTGVSFRLDGVDVTTNAQWFERPHDHRVPIESALARGGFGTLNLYTAAVGSEMLGFSTFPQWARDRPGLGGVVVDYRSLPGGPFPHFDRGLTAVHEIGHWLGLFHTFENGCQPPGDGVDDTPYEALPTIGCPAAKDTCPAPGADPVHNFMDYGFDSCMREFTPGQGLRIRTMWAAYRIGAVPAAGQARYR
ncbi:zinc metalloprotease [Actinoallomurus purpureus]|uniref:zinc metalloprotease n=1 Tax=Actinoallomurus purpureus TaxID=478114 RepID=UPI0020934EE3|nr:zinc metalloprotease [Actinoallomurus purpureus]MCO6008778.1 zinc metalloprotease [Actinoallomurus purpureus]